jgi:hypothetical protein
MRKRFIGNMKPDDKTAEYGECVICGQDTRHRDDTGAVRLCKAPECRSFSIMTADDIKRTDMVACGLILEVPDDTWKTQDEVRKTYSFAPLKLIPPGEVE